MTSFSSPTSSFDCAGEIEWLAKRTGLTEEEVKKRQETFQKQFPNGQVGKEEFREIASNLIDDSENDIDAFVDNVYRMFDLNQDRSLDFGEFVVATASAQSAIGEHGLGEEKPFDRMTWLFENVYDVDKSGKLTHGELEEVMVDLMKGEGLAFEANKALKNKARETVMDLFREMDADGDGLVINHCAVFKL